jgi:hypothetical protein
MFDTHPSDTPDARLVDRYAAAYGALRAAGEALFDLAARAEGDPRVDVDALLAGVEVAMGEDGPHPASVAHLRAVALEAAALQARETRLLHEEGASGPQESLTPLGQAAARARAALGAAVAAVHRADDLARARARVRAMG